MVVWRKEEQEGWSEALPRHDVQRVGSGEALVRLKGEAEGSALRENGFASNAIAIFGNKFNDWTDRCTENAHAFISMLEHLG